MRNNFLQLLGYVRHTRATFKTDPLNVLAYTADPTAPFSASDQDRNAYSTGLRFDYTYVHSKEHLIKTGFQIDRTQSVNKTRLFTFADDGAGNPTGDLLSLNADNRQVGIAKNSGFRINGARMIGGRSISGCGRMSYSICAMKGRSARVLEPPISTIRRMSFTCFMAGMFTPPNLEAISFAKLNTAGTKAQPEDTTNNTVRAERAHYFEVGELPCAEPLRHIAIHRMVQAQQLPVRCRAVRHHALVELFCVRTRLADEASTAP